ncbi:hypothetical protein L210DRAFT_3651500 [Boletus edulis BED1]|uniref:Uncharacterized protein n=1 Tax=Boletus edulis BED1 TaxID=1328754 RepID=A0AAD4BI64_BOLED|nr:hypothetical protein L210DRAFT_3651500 [Boletus edulis BED1]
MKLTLAQLVIEIIFGDGQTDNLENEMQRRSSRTSGFSPTRVNDMSFSPHEVYARCLLGDHGYPLWTPQLNTELRETYQLEGLKIGDVGVVSPIDSSFDVLLNITLPRSEQPYPKLVRENFTPIVLDHELDLASQPDAVAAHGVVPSASVQLTSKDIDNHDQTPSRADYEFSLSSENGAVLVLPEGAQSCDLRNENKFLDVAIKHGVDWYECATKEAGRLIHDNSLYLITGFHKTRSWSLGAVGRSGSSLQNRRCVKFKVGEIHQGGVTARAYFWVATHGFTGRVGPMYPYEDSNRIPRIRPGNQTVFIRGFRITVNKLLFMKTVSVKTRQGTFFGLKTHLAKLVSHRKSESASSENTTDNAVDQDFSLSHNRLHTDAHITIDRVPDVSQTIHPGDMINQYMLKEEPSAVVAVTHDSLWIKMLQTGLLKLEDFADVNSLGEVLSKYYDVILQDNGVYLQKS